LALCVECGLDEQETGARAIVRCDDDRNRKWSKTFETRRPDKIQRQVVGHHPAHRDADENILYEKREYDEGCNDSTGSGDSERSQNIFKHHDAARP
jgi:hypothetical protein